jgi:hypothetical protein
MNVFRVGVKNVNRQSEHLYIFTVGMVDSLSRSEYKRGSQKVPRILEHKLFDAPCVCTSRTEYRWSFLCENFAEDNGFHIVIMQTATHCLCSDSLPRKNIPFITQPPYSLDLAPSDFSLFPAWKMGLKGTEFATMENIKSNATEKNSGDSKTSLVPVLPTMAGLKEQVCARAGHVCVHKGPTLKVTR